jgi:hypothetical protein
MFGWIVAETAGWSRAKNLRDSPVQLLYNFTGRASGTRSRDRRGMRLPPPTKNLLRNLAREFDGYLRQSATSTLEPWQQEIRDYLRSGKMPTLFARNNLAEWGRRRGLLTQAPARLSNLAADNLRSKAGQTGLKNR